LKELKGVEAAGWPAACPRGCSGRDGAHGGRPSRSRRRWRMECSGSAARSRENEIEDCGGGEAQVPFKTHETVYRGRCAPRSR
jgi:hypothetical protein